MTSSDSPTGHAPASLVARWWRSRQPTREAIVVSAMLALLFGTAYLGAFFIRSELLLRQSDADAILSTILTVVVVKLLLFYWFGHAHRPWRAARFSDLSRLVRTATLATLVLVALNQFADLVPGNQFWIPIPRSVLVLDWAFTLIAVGGLQALARSVYEEIVPVTPAGNVRSVLVIDGSEAGRALARSLTAMRQPSFFVAGLLDDDPDNYGISVGRARVLGPIGMAPACAERLRIREVIIREGSIFGGRLRALCDACAVLGVRVSVAQPRDRAPAAVGHAEDAPAPTVRDIELRDLLARPQARLNDRDADVLPFLGGKTVLVTGAGGSIGAEICRQVVRFAPATLVMVERSEYSLFQIDRELAASPHVTATRLVPVICDLTNADRVEQVLVDHRPDVVIHAAAYKHVPLMESHPIEAIENNALATATLAELADAQGVGTFVALSTDKAVNPSSVMGASKLVADRFLQAFDSVSRTRFVVVRFGNVLGSSGSAVPIFTEQLSNRRPITITHRDVRRYFMTIDEAAQLVLLAGGLAERGGTFVLEMGEAIRIVDLVTSLAFVLRVPADELRIDYCGLRLPAPAVRRDDLHQGLERAVPVAGCDGALEFGEPGPHLRQGPRRSRGPDDQLVRRRLAELKSAVAAGDQDGAFQALMEIVATDCGSGEPQPADAPGTSHAAPRAGRSA